jgi:hypothetical protein
MANAHACNVNDRLVGGLHARSSDLHFGDCSTRSSSDAPIGDFRRSFQRCQRPMPGLLADEWVTQWPAQGMDCGETHVN